MKRIGYVLCLALSWAAVSGRAEVEGPVRDDPRGRQAARALEQGVRTSDDSLRLLEIARSEARRWGISNLGAGPLQATRVPGNAWVNLGPRTANFEKNGVTYYKVDSGRPRTILVHPTSPDIVYLATSGGGVWKTFDATAAIDATNGPHWTPITETLGALSIGALAMSPVNADSLLVGLGDPFDVQVPGFFHSDDGGASPARPVPGTAAGCSAPVHPARKGTAGCQNTPYMTYDPKGRISAVLSPGPPLAYRAPRLAERGGSRLNSAAQGRRRSACPGIAARWPPGK